MNGQPFEIPSVEEEMQYMRNHYDNHLEDWIKKKLTFEQFVEQHKCKCGRFGHE